MAKKHHRSEANGNRESRQGVEVVSRRRPDVRLWNRLKTGAADHRVFVVLCFLALLCVGIVLSYRPGSAQAQNAGDPNWTAATLVRAETLRQEGDLSAALKALALLDEGLLTRSERTRYNAELAAVMGALRGNTGAIASSEETARSLAQLQSCLVETESELAELHFAAGKYDEAMRAANAAIDAAPDLAASVEPIREKVVGTWFSEETNNLMGLAEEKGAEEAAFVKMQSICAVLDGWQAPRLLERKSETQVRWARKTLPRLADEALLNAALDALQANKPATASDPMWNAPVVRAEKIDERNLEALIGVWSWARSNSYNGLLHRKAIARAAEMPLDVSLLQGNGHDFSATTISAIWMLVEAKQFDKAGMLIERLPAGTIERQYATVFSLLWQHRYEETLAAADQAPDDSVAGSTPDEVRVLAQTKTWIQVFKFRALVALQRVDEAKALATELVAARPDDSSVMAYAGNWLAQQGKVAGGRGAGSAATAPSDPTALAGR